MPDEKWGEVPKAFVTCRPGADADRGRADRLLPGALAHFKAPNAIEFGELPKTSTGKIQKFELRERGRLAAHAAAAAAGQVAEALVEPADRRVALLVLRDGFARTRTSSPSGSAPPSALLRPRARATRVSRL